MSKMDSFPVWKSLSYIALSLLTISLPSYLIYRHSTGRIPEKKTIFIQKIAQTGPQKEGLKSAFFAEVLGLSKDHPTSFASFDKKKQETLLRNHPIIEKVRLDLLPEGTLFIDYTLRQPIALLGDIDNIAMDRLGYAFPLKPFFTPKNLPTIYFGVAAFGIVADELTKPTIAWNEPIQGPMVELAFMLLKLLGSDALKGTFDVITIDISKAFAPSLGIREIVLEIEETIPIQDAKKKITLKQKRYLRLSNKNFAKEIGNYLKLREKMAEEYTKSLSSGQMVSLYAKQPIIDLRLEKMAFIKE